ncbi:hypothetical protein WR25_09301 [Diploscapter pachys]|uniref:Fibronectin type-III domain-containing protein n=1 Tax=Diploscapter pachys TaxID=2018661 RepID=A0A2A2L0X3_9BILA|nr:hypothetical protein WR25_09301 [Diploscapter pachys]
MRVGYSAMLLLLAIPLLLCTDFGSAECSKPLEEYGKLEARSRLAVGYKGFSTELECIFTRRHNSETDKSDISWIVSLDGTAKVHSKYMGFYIDDDHKETFNDTDHLSLSTEGRYACYSRKCPELNDTILLKVKDFQGRNHTTFNDASTQWLKICCDNRNVSSREICDNKNVKHCNALAYECTHKEISKALSNFSNVSSYDFGQFRTCLNDDHREDNQPSSTIMPTEFMRTCCKNLLVKPGCCIPPDNSTLTNNVTFSDCSDDLPKILTCHNAKYTSTHVVFPPSNLNATTQSHDSIEVCWENGARYRNYGVIDYRRAASGNGSNFKILSYTIFYKEVPQSLFGYNSSDLLSALLHDSRSLVLPSASQTTHEQIELVQSFTSLLHGSDDSEEMDINEILESKSKYLARYLNQTFNATNSSCATLTGLRHQAIYLIYITARYEIEGVQFNTIPSEIVTGTTEKYEVQQKEVAERIKSYCLKNVADGCEFVCNVDGSYSPNFWKIAHGNCSTNGTFRIPFPYGGSKLDHVNCCRRKKVENGCLSLCEDEPLEHDAFTNFCMANHLSAVYQCIQEYIDFIPHPVESFVVDKIGDTSATVKWNPPSKYPLSYIRAYEIKLIEVFHMEFGEEATKMFYQSRNKTSLAVGNLQPSSIYVLSIRTIPANITNTATISQPRIVSFTTRAPHENHRCEGGRLPLQIDENYLVYCARDKPCPDDYDCVESNTESICCPLEDGSNLTSAYKQCCRSMNVDPACVIYCSFEKMMPTYCQDEIKSHATCAIAVLQGNKSVQASVFMFEYALQNMSETSHLYRNLFIILNAMCYVLIAIVFYKSYRLKKMIKEQPTSYENPLFSEKNGTVRMRDLLTGEEEENEEQPIEKIENREDDDI